MIRVKRYAIDIFGGSGQAPPMPVAWKAPVAVVVGLAATGIVIWADAAGWGLSGTTFAMLGTLVGFVPGYLVRSPNEQSP